MFVSWSRSMTMPKSYSADLRWRIVWQVCLQGKCVEEVARGLYVSEKSVRRYVDLYVTSGEVTREQSHHSPHRKLNDFEELTLLQSVLSKPGLYLRELQQELQEVTGSWVDVSTICRTLRRLGLTRKKMKRVAIQRSEVRRVEYLAEILAYKPEMLVFIDETGSDRRHAIRQYAYQVRGITPVDYRLFAYGKRISAIRVMTSRGIEDTYLVEGNVNATKFLQFIQHCLLPILLPFDGDNPRSVVVLDNASIHHVEAVTELISSTGALVRFLPPYSPDLNPIEEAFSKLKAYLRENDAAYSSTKAARLLVAMGFSTITTEDCCGYFRHAGYMWSIQKTALSYM